MILCGTSNFGTASIIAVRIRTSHFPGDITMCGRRNGLIISRLISCASKGIHLLMRTAMPTGKCTICSIHLSNRKGRVSTIRTTDIRGSFCGLALGRGNSVASLFSGEVGGRLMGTNGTVHLTLFARGGSFR